MPLRLRDREFWLLDRACITASAKAAAVLHETSRAAGVKACGSTSQADVFIVWSHCNVALIIKAGRCVGAIAEIIR